MITRIQQSRGGTSGVLDYNEDKVEKGVAWPIECVGMNNSSFSIYTTFREMETNPAIPVRVKNLAFHMTVNPGPGDTLGEDDIKEYVAEVMERLGYEGQPYVIYRHDDIERVHYHVVSVRVDAAGHVIDDSFEGRRLMAIQRDLAPVFGFTVGLGDEEKEQELPPPERLVAGMNNLIAHIRSNVEAALRYNCRNTKELKAVLLAYGIRMKQTIRTDREYFSFSGITSDNKTICRPVGLKRTMGLTVDQFGARIRETVQRGEKTPKGRICEIVRAVFSESVSIEDMARRLSARGISMMAMSHAGKMPSRARDAADFLFVNTHTREVASLDDTGIALTAMLELAQQTKQKKKEQTNKPKKKKKAPSEVRHKIR